MQKITKRFLVLSSVIILPALIGWPLWNNYQQQQSQIAYEKEEALKLVKIESNELEKRAKFLDIKLDTYISNYKGFRTFDSWNSVCHNTMGVIDESANEKAWGYSLKDRKYSSIGYYQLGSRLEDIRRVVKNPTKKQVEGSDTKIMVFTLADKVYKIHADIEELTIDGSTSGSSFNNFLHSVYGPSINDNGYNKVEYLSTDNLTWESKNVLLTTETESRLNYVNNKLSVFRTHITHVEYIFKPLQEKLNEISGQQSAKKSQEAVDKI